MPTMPFYEAATADTFQGWVSGLTMPDADRLPYAPTPLAPWNLRTTDGLSYMELSAAKIDALVAPHASRYPAWLVAGVHESLLQAHSTRCEQNVAAAGWIARRLREQGLTATEASLLKRAATGAADQLELLRLKAVSNLGLYAVELAKQSHPFSWDTGAMDDAVIEAIHEYDPDVMWPLRDPAPRYSFVRVDSPRYADTRALMIVRKRDVAFVGPERDVRVVKRSGFALRVDKELPEHERAPRSIRVLVNGTLRNGPPDKQFLNSIGEAVAAEGEAVEDAIRRQFPWIVPISTSYYARGKHIPEEYPRVTEARFFYGAIGNGALRLVT